MASASVQTAGLAGFFGLPVAYTPFATQPRHPQLPGLSAPTIDVTDSIMQSHVAQCDADAVLQSPGAG